MRCVLLCFVLFVNSVVFSQELFFKSISTEQNLPSSETYQLLQDSKGYIWFTSDAGICRFDGKKIVTYSAGDGIPESVIFWIKEDRRGRIWFNTLSGSFFYYENGEFYSIHANEALKKICTPYPVSSFFIGENDTLYCGTMSIAALLKIPPQENYKNVIVEKSALCNRFILKNKFDNQTVMGSGNHSIKKTDNTFSFLINDTIIQVPLSGRHSQNNPFRGKMGKGNIVYLPNANQLIVIGADKRIRCYNFKNDIIDLNLDRYNGLWVGTVKGGGYYYKDANLDAPPEHFLPDLSVSNCLLDREGTIWACTLEKGIFQCKNKNISYISMPGEKVCSQYKTVEKLFMATNMKNEISVSKFPPGIKISPIKDLDDNALLKCLVKEKNYAYYGTMSNLIYVSGNEKKPVKARNEHFIYAKKMVATGNDSFLYIATMGFGYVQNGIASEIFHPSLTFQTIVQLQNKKILASSRNNPGIFELRGSSTYPFLNEFKELKVRINEMREDAKGNLWIATNEKGIFCYSQGLLLCFNEQKGLISNKVNAFDFDGSGNIWTATNKGLSKISTAENIADSKITSFNESNGLPNIEIDLITFFKGELWCTANECVLHFYPEKMKMNTIAPLININAIHVNGIILLPTKENIFDYRKKNIDFEFNSSTFKNPQQKEYTYKLQGYDNQWKYTTIEKVQYTNLPPGNYTFYVSAFNNDKIKSSTPASFTFTIEPPFWMRWWFIILEIIAILVLMYCTYLLFARRMKAKEDQRILVNKKIADFQLTAVRAQMNPHFIFNAISSIQHYILKNDIYQSYNYLAKFSLLIRNVLENSKDEYITLSQDIHSIGLYIELEKIRFKEPFRSVITVDQTLDPEDTFIPTMLIQPYVENAIWHGLMPKQGDAELLIDFAAINKQLQITIKDNGVGRTEQQKSNHNSLGMSLIEKRLESLEVKNQQQFSVRIKYLKDDSGNNTGTEVILLIPIINF